MRQAPVNYLVTIVLSCVLWVGTAIFAGRHFSDTVILQAMAADEFVRLYQAVVGGASCFGLLLALYWYLYGGRDAVAARLPDARRRWSILLLAELLIAAGALITLVLVFRGESLSGTDIAKMFVLLLLQTVVLFWGCTFVMSPRAVEYIPWGKR